MDNTFLNLYHTFAVVARTQSLSAAANELFISQPAISKSIKKLENELSTTLFYRNSKGVTLTPEGAQLYDYISRAFDVISAGEENLRHINELGIGTIRIGVSSTLCKHMLLPYIKGFVNCYPNIRISIVCQSTQHTIKLLENDEIDIGLIAKPNDNAKLHLISLGEIEDVFVATPDYINNLKERDHIHDDKLLYHGNLILLDKQNVTRRYIDKYLNDWNIDIQNALEINSMELLIDFAKTSLGIGCVIKEFVTEELANHSLLQIDTPCPIHKRSVCFAYSAHANHSNSVIKFIDYIS